jgi:hypothetical protein
MKNVKLCGIRSCTKEQWTMLKNKVKGGELDE